MKDIVSFSLWLYWCSHEELSRSEILVFAMFYTDSADFSSGPSLIYKKFGGTIAREHIQRAFSKLEARQFIARNGKFRKNPRGKPTPEYDVNDRWMEIAREELAKWTDEYNVSKLAHNEVDNVSNLVHNETDNVPNQDGYDPDNVSNLVHNDAKKQLDNVPKRRR